MKCDNCGFEGDKWKDWKRNLEFNPTFICPKCGFVERLTEEEVLAKIATREI